VKIKRFQIWRKISYRDVKKFRFWSTQIRGEGDETLAKESSLKDWRKVVVLKPLGDLKTVFSVGFSDNFGNVKVSKASRRVEEGPFGMRMGPEDCRFFIVSNNGEVGLEFAEHTTIADVTKSELALY